MQRTLSYLLLAGLLFGACRDSLAIATGNSSTSERPPTAEGYSFNWDYIYNYQDASAVAVDHYWVLTAAHVADDDKAATNLTINGTLYTQQEIVPHPFADLALVRYDKPLPGYYLLGNSVPVGEEVLFCGFGYSGNVVSSRFSAYFTDDLTGDGIKRWGSNRIDRELTYPYAGPAPLGSTTNQGFEITISRSNSPGKTDYEAGGNVFDSGAGLFYQGSQGWELVGNMTTRTNNGSNYTGNFAVATKYHVDWIKSVVVDYDTDMDGLPDWWETEYGGDATSMVAVAHSDSDAYTNYEEWLADTNPTNALSFLDTAYVPPASVLILNGSTNRQYQIQARGNLADTNAAWLVVENWFDGTGTQMVQSVSTTPSNGFYRVRAKLR